MWIKSEKTEMKIEINGKYESAFQKIVVVQNFCYFERVTILKMEILMKIAIEMQIF